MLSSATPGKLGVVPDSARESTRPESQPDHAAGVPATVEPWRDPLDRPEPAECVLYQLRAGRAVLQIVLAPGGWGVALRAVPGTALRRALRSLTPRQHRRLAGEFERAARRVRLVERETWARHRRWQATGRGAP